jgi:hypothetical protein
MESGLEECVRISLKTGKLYRKQHVGMILENEIKELDSVKTCKYLDIEENQIIQDEPKVAVHLHYR